MKKGKKQIGKHSPHKDFKWVAIISGIILTLLFSVLIFPFAFMQFSYYQAQQNNPAKKLAAIMVPFAEKNNLKEIDEYSVPAVGLGNTIPYFTFIYQSNQSVNQLHELTKNYLEQAGYKINDSFSTYTTGRCSLGTYVENNCSSFYGYTKNKNKPYWVMIGKNLQGDIVQIEISDKMYFNRTEDDTSAEYGEHAIPFRKTVLNIRFISHECLTCSVSSSN